MVELRKRPAADPAPPPAKRQSSAKGVPRKAKPDPKQKPTEDAKPNKSAGPPVEQAPHEPEVPKPSKKSGGPPKKDDVVSLDGFGGKISLSDDTSTSLASLIDASKNGVVIFMYPRANTPGCTKQACLFRDAYKELAATGFDIYGLSNDSPKSNTTFRTKQSLPYGLLCDPNSTLIGALGFKKPPKSTTRGVVVFGKTEKGGQVLETMAGGPDATFQAAKAAIEKK